MEKTFSTRNLKLASYLRYKDIPILQVKIDRGMGVFVFGKNDQTKYAVEQFTDRAALVEPHRFLAQLYDLKGEVSKTIRLETCKHQY